MLSDEYSLKSYPFVVFMKFILLLTPLLFTTNSRSIMLPSGLRFVDILSTILLQPLSLILQDSLVLCFPSVPSQKQ
jgi:hypothetical protein